MIGALPLLSLFFGCQPASIPQADAVNLRLRSTAEDEAIFSWSFALTCDGEEDDPCATLRLDGSDSESAEGEIVSWYWEIDDDTSDTSSIRFKPTINDEGSLESHQAVTLLVEDEAGNAEERSFWIEVYIDDSESLRTLPFWFMVSHLGTGCERRITAHAPVGGCFITDDFEIGWMDYATSAKTTFFVNDSNGQTLSNGAWMIKHTSSRITIGAEPATLSGIFYLGKPEVGIINIFDDSCVGQNGATGGATGG
ncbi:MAG: hypothetical protein AAFV53_37810 [Myxococcota bacterium]